MVSANILPRVLLSVSIFGLIFILRVAARAHLMVFTFETDELDWNFYYECIRNPHHFRNIGF